MKLGPRSSEPGGGSAADSPAPTVPGAPGNQPQRQSAQNIALPNKATLWHPIVLQVSPLGTAHRTAAALTRRNAANRSIAMASVIIRARSDEIVFRLRISQSGVSQMVYPPTESNPTSEGLLRSTLAPPPLRYARARPITDARFAPRTQRRSGGGARGRAFRWRAKGEHVHSLIAPNHILVPFVL